MLENQWVDVICPKCKYAEGVRLINMKLEETIICHNCKANIDLIDQTASVHAAVRDINNTLNNFRNLLK